LQEALAAAQAENVQAHEALANAQSQEVAVVAPVSAGDASSSSLRVLELAQRTADELVATARIEVDTLRSATDAEVAQLRADAQSEAETLVSDANNTVATITREFETQRAGLERRIEELVTYEREYRSRLRIYLEGQLRELESKNLAGDRQVTGE
jgi:cell division septum initiation protein DivIVA